MTDPFDLLDVPARFDLDPQVLRTRYLKLAAEHHPDQAADPLAQADAAERSAEFNRAYQTLRDPEQRARALLQRLRGGDLERMDQEQMPPDLLMEMMEIREELEDAIASDNTSELDRLRGWARDRRQEGLDRLGTAFQDEDLDAVQRELYRLRYIERMLEQMP